MKSKFAEKWFFLILFLLAFVLVTLIFRPFLAVLIVGASFAVVLYPVFLWFKKKHIPSTLAAFFVTVLFAVALGIPLIGIGAIVFHQSQNVYQDLVQGGGAVTLLDGLNDSLRSVLPDGYALNLRERVVNSASLIATNVAGAFTATLSTLLAVLLMFISLFYFLKDGARWVQELIHLSPLSDRDDNTILVQLAQAVNGVIRGYLFIALVQGLLVGIGLAIFGVPNPALWGLVAMVASLLPTIGTALVSIPAVLFLFFTGDTWQAIGLALWAALLVGMIDNFLSPLVVGNRVHIPPLFILFAVLGGIVLLGPVGLLVGPLAVSLLHTLVTIYKNELSKRV